jgi:hypothetical protein
MSPRQQLLKTFIDQATISFYNEEIKPDIIDDYKILNEKCDYIIKKIKMRKEKQQIS